MSWGLHLCFRVIWQTAQNVLQDTVKIPLIATQVFYPTLEVSCFETTEQRTESECSHSLERIHSHRG